MRKITILLLIAIATTFSFTACKTDAKKSESTDVEKSETKKSNAAFAVANAKNEINFIAYKFTEKTPVGGQFQTVNILSGGEGNSVKEAINNTEFSIPISSLFTKDAGRDYKIKTYFFGVMDKTELLTGKLNLTDDANGIAEIKMNGVSQKVPFSYTIVDKTFNMTTSIDVNNWNASVALASLNKICEVLHKGTDGISKTWSEVGLNITSTF